MSAAKRVQVSVLTFVCTVNAFLIFTTLGQNVRNLGFLQS